MVVVDHAIIIVTANLYSTLKAVYSEAFLAQPLLALLHNTSRLTASQFLLYLTVPLFFLLLGATSLFPGHERL